VGQYDPFSVNPGEEEIGKGPLLKNFNFLFYFILFCQLTIIYYYDPFGENFGILDS
jgi:hypothetical protein